jgi:hypothetical protein
MNFTRSVAAPCRRRGAIGEYLGVDTVVEKRRLGLLQPQAPQPRRNARAALPVVEPFS